VDGTSWMERAAAVVLLWTELLDETSLAEDCEGPAELLQRRDVTRRDLRRYLERASPIAAPEKWVARTLWNEPPKRGFLDAQHKDILLGWVHSTSLGAEARASLERGVRALFVDGAAEEAALLAARPQLLPTVRRLLTPFDEPRIDADIESVPARLLLADASVPMYLTDPELKRVVWTNRSLQAFIGLARDRLRGMPFDELVGLALSLCTEEERAAYVDAQRRVVQAGRETGYGVIEARVNLDRRTWVLGQPTPPWSGSWWLTAHAHFVMDPVTDRRLGSLVMWFLRPA
jgi:hypothetical protein